MQYPVCHPKNRYTTKIPQQVRLVQLGALAPLIAMAEMETRPQQYAGVALLKLADSFENHTRIAQEGGIQTLLWLGRSCNMRQELQYKAACTVGSLASQAASPGKKRSAICRRHD